MGFNLQMFFDELQVIYDDEGLDNIQRLKAIRECIEHNRKYAAECGQIED